jgi:hypothetical protein
MRYTISAFALALASTASAQSPAPSRISPAVQQLRAATMIAPRIELIAPAEPKPGSLQQYQVKVSGLSNQKAVHLGRVNRP